MTTTEPSNTSRGAARAVAVAVYVAMLVCAHTDLLIAQRLRSTPRPTQDTVRADDGHALIVWSKRPRDRAVGSILLLHGRTWSSLPNFDLLEPLPGFSTVADTASGDGVWATQRKLRKNELTVRPRLLLGLESGCDMIDRDERRLDWSAFRSAHDADD